MGLTRWDPFEDLVALRDAFGRILGDGSWRTGLAATGKWRPSVDMYETNDNVVVRADLPGVNRDDLEVTMTDNSLTIKGESKTEHEIESGNVFRRERFSGQFMRTLPLNVGVKADQAKASFNHGVLEITIPKTEESRVKTRRIDIN
jgi:HSP20 family protein